MLLAHKTAVIYGAGGGIGSAVARAFAREGARLFLVGRTRERLDKVAKEIGGADVATVDALDGRGVETHMAEAARQAGRVDILFNAIGMEDVQGIPLVDLPLPQFEQPVLLAMRTQYATCVAAARQMMAQGSGVILTITATPARLAFPLSGGFGVACAALEGLCRSLAAEVGPHGVRVVCLRSAGSPDSPAAKHAMDVHAKAAGKTSDEFIDFLANQTLLHRLPTVDEVANMAVLIASDHASAMTAAVANITCGAFAD